MRHLLKGEETPVSSILKQMNLFFSFLPCFTLFLFFFFCFSFFWALGFIVLPILPRSKEASPCDWSPGKDGGGRDGGMMEGSGGEGVCKL